MSEPEIESRRPLRSRGTAQAQGLARRLAGWGVRPDAISAASLGFAAVGAALLALAPAWGGGPGAAGLMAAALCIQLRLVCNLLDGMVAVEHGQGGPLGPLWNEAPDRVADSLLLIGAGYGCGLAYGVELGYAAALAAVFTAYVRELGHGLGLPPDFGGPMAKPQRMALLTAAAAFGTIAPWPGELLRGALALIAVGSVLTAWLRLRRQARALRERAS